MRCARVWSQGFVGVHLAIRVENSFAMNRKAQYLILSLLSHVISSNKKDAYYPACSNPGSCSLFPLSSSLPEYL